MKKRVLLTGFEPFGGDTVNPALEAIRRLNNQTIEDERGTIQVLTSAMPTVFGRAIEELQRRIDEIQPDVVICVGQAGGRHQITPERVAINVDDARIPDNAGNQPVDEPVAEGGPVAYWSTLPIKSMVQKMHEAGVPAAVSNSAGTFVCNHIFYGLMHYLETSYPNVRGGFIHIPFLPEQVLHREAPSMSLDTIVKGLEVCVQVAAWQETDARISAGKEH